jgi:putative ABC transport system permease protein
MTLLRLALRNAGRNRGQTLLTVLAIAFGLVCFLLLRTVLWAWTVAVDEGVKDRIASWNKVTFQLPLPSAYVGRARAIEGIQATTFANWFGAKDPRHPGEFFSPLAVDTDTYFRVYDDMEVAPAQLAAWRDDRQGAILGDALLAKLGYKIGDRVTLQGSTYPGDWQFRIVGSYRSKSRTVDRSQFLFHWKYLDDSVPDTQRSQVGWLMSRVDPKRTVELSRALDALFEDQPIQTLSMSEQSMKLVFLSNFSALLDAVNVICGVILGIIVLILGNTLAIRVRARTHEYGVIGAIGFRRREIVGLVLGEAAIVGAIGGGVGLGLSYLLIDRGIGPFLEANIGSFFPYFRLPVAAAAVGLAFSMGGAVAAAVIPALRTARLDPVDALRKID